MWFSVKENLPLPNTKVLTYSPELGEGAHRILETNNGKFYAMVTHWIPLPVPPTAEERGVSALQTTNNARDEICSVHVCAYCEKDKTCQMSFSRCLGAHFKGRKLSPVA